MLIKIVLQHYKSEYSFGPNWNNWLTKNTDATNSANLERTLVTVSAKTGSGNDLDACSRTLKDI